MLMFYAILNILYATIFSVIFILLGLLVLKQLVNFNIKKFSPYSLEVSTAFFLGLTVFLTLWRVIAYISRTAFIPLLLVLSFSVILIILNYKFLYSYIRFNLGKCVFSLFFCLLFILFGIIHALIPMPDIFLARIDNTMPAYGFGGVVHSLRAGNISFSIVKENYIPVLNQNYGQSLLSSITMFLGLNNPQFVLVVWLNLVIFFLSLLVYGVVNLLVGNRLYSILGTTICMLGNTALFPAYIEITDTGSTNLLIRSVDTIVGFVSFLFFIIVSYLLIKHQNYIINKYFAYLTIIIIGFSWNIFAAHNIFLSILFIITFSLYLKFQNQFEFKKISYILLFLFIGFFVGIWPGSMILPNRFVDKVSIPGVMSLFDNGPIYTLLEIRPKMYLMNFDTINRSRKLSEYLMKYDSQINIFTNNLPNQIDKNKVVFDNKESGDSFFSMFKQGHSLRWVVNLLLIFFPLLGFLIFALLIFNDILPSIYKDFIKIVWLSSIVLFVFGLLCSSFVVLYGKEIEISRFMGFGNFMAMLFLGISTSYILKMRRFIAMTVLLSTICVIIFSLTGPFLQYFFVGIVGNFYLPAEVDTKIFDLQDNAEFLTLSMRERFEVMMSINTMVGINKK